MRNLAIKEPASWLACALLVAACSGAGSTTTPDGGVPDGGIPDGGEAFELEWPPAGTSSAQATLTPDVAGIYRVALLVTDSQGAVSDPALLEIEVEDP